MASYIRRGKFLATLLGGTAAAWPLAARAQQGERVRRIVRDPREIERSVAAFARSPNGGLVGTQTASATVYRDVIIAVAARQKLPAVYGNRYDVAAGGLISYAPDIVDQFRQTAGYVDRILKGAKRAEMPVQAPTKYQLMINLKTAKALGLDVHASLLARATSASQGIGAALIKAYRARNYPSIPPFFTRLVYDGV